MNKPEKTSIKQSIEMMLNIDKKKNSILEIDTTFENYLPIDKLLPNINQPRHYFSENDLNELVHSIKQDGILQPLLVRQKEDDKYEIIAGERRWRAAKQAGLKMVPVVIKNVSDDASLSLAIIENIIRSQLNIIEEAKGFEKLITKFNMTHDTLAARVGRSRSSITNIMRLLSLPEKVQEALKFQKIHFGHAKLLLTCTKEIAEQICNEIVDKALSVRQTEALVKKLLKKHPELTNGQTEVAFNYSMLIPAMSKLFGVQVEIIPLKNGKQKLTCVFESIDALQSCLDKIAK